MSSQQSWAAWLLDSYASSVSPVTSESPYRHHQESDSPSTTEDASSSNSSSTTTSTRGTSTVPSPMSPSSLVSPSPGYGPYVRTGRGGAGNLIRQTELRPAPTKSSSSSSSSTSSSDQARVDLESHHHLPALALPQTSSLSERREAAARLDQINTQEDWAHTRRNSSSTTSTQQQYVSVGRGGAGNYYYASEKRSPGLPLTATSTSKSGRKASGSLSPTLDTTAQYPIHPGRGGAGNYAAAVEAGGRRKAEAEQEERRAAEQRREQIVEEVDGLLQPPPGAWLGTARRRSAAIYDDPV
ncbi:hypothetical protein ABEF95_005999 [Exophiala dermatitidis]